MGEIIISLLEKLTGVELIASLTALLVAIQTLVRLLGEFFTKLGQFGKFADDEGWMDSFGSFLRSVSTWIGSGVSWFGIGNKK